MKGANSVSPDDIPQLDAAHRLRRLFALALLARIGLALVLYFSGAGDTFAPDQQTYHAFGKFVSDQWVADVHLPGAGLKEGPKGYIYIVASIYYLMGEYALIPILLNCLIGALTVLVVYDLTQRMGGSLVVALRAATYATWFPSLVLWSTLNIRDVWIILLILLICRQASVLHSRPSIGSLLLLGTSVIAIVQFRAYILFAVAGPVVVSFLAQRTKSIGRNLVLGSVAAIALIYADQSAGTSRKARVVDFEEMNKIRYWNTTEAQSHLGQADISTPGKALIFLPKGLAFFLLAPFPWMLGSVRQIAAVPEMLFVYSLIPSIIRGIRFLIRNQLRTSLMPLLITAGLTVGYALGEGNAGTAYRHRAQILCFFLIYAAIGRVRQTAAEATAPTRRSVVVAG